MSRKTSPKAATQTGSAKKKVLAKICGFCKYLKYYKQFLPDPKEEDGLSDLCQGCLKWASNRAVSSL